MECCIVTGRLFDSTNRKGTHKSFRKYVIKHVEDKMKEITLAGVDPSVTATSEPEDISTPTPPTPTNDPTPTDTAATADEPSSSYKKVRPICLS